MDKFFVLKLALKNLLANRMRTFFTLLGVVIGISAIVVLVSFAFGLQRLVTSEVTGGNALKLVDVGTGSSKVVKLNQNSINNIDDLGDVERVDSTINAGAKIINGDNSTDATIYGTSANYLELSGISVRWGERFNETEDRDMAPREMIINTSCTTFFGADPDDLIGQEKEFVITIPKEIAETNSGLEVEKATYKIVGVVKNDEAPILYTYIDNLKIDGAKNYSQAKVTVKDRDLIEKVRKQIENMGYKTEYVGDTINQIEQIFAIFRIILGSFGLIALIVAALGMFNTLTISLMERIREIALFKILGMARKDIRFIFLVESSIFGLTGGLAGVLLGVLVGVIFNAVLNFYAVQSGGESVSVFYYNPWFIIVIIIFAFLMSLLTGLYPSRRAAKVAALDVMRYE